jgi:hypothetical protein
MDRASFRLEIIKLTYKVGIQNPAETAVDQAKKLEAYVLESGGGSPNDLLKANATTPQEPHDSRERPTNPGGPAQAEKPPKKKN